ncbi:hypothetical protein AB0L06_00090 [Spirillospora sp. NPDC052269]
MNLRAVVTATACALALGAAAVPAHAAPARPAACDFSQRGLTIEQAVSKLNPVVQKRFQNHPSYASFKNKKLSSLPVTVRKDFETSCKKGK